MSTSSHQKRYKTRETNDCTYGTFSFITLQTDLSERRRHLEAERCDEPEIMSTSSHQERCITRETNDFTLGTHFQFFFTLQFDVNSDSCLMKNTLIQSPRRGEKTRRISVLIPRLVSIGGYNERQSVFVCWSVW